MRLRTLPLALLLSLAAGLALQASDWPEWRGPTRDGRSGETGLPDRWSPAGENLAWTLPFGGRSAPVVFGNRLYLQTATTGDIALTQERLVAVDAASGKVLWEKRFNIYLSDVPQGRVGWASPAVDPQTGNIYLLTVAAQLIGLSPDGTVLWDRSLAEEYGAITTHGGRTSSPIIDGDKILLNVLLQGWGPDLGRPGNRFFAFDTRTGQTIWVSSPQARHYDTNYVAPIIAEINGARLMIVGGTDGTFHALQVETGKPVWSLELSKRAILNGALFRDNVVYVTHGEENIDTTQMGMIAAVDATGTGALPKSAFRWVTYGFLPTFASPVMDAERLYTVDNGAILGAFDLKSGQQVWTRTLGTLQKGSPVLADGKLYIGTENGKFFILRPGPKGVDVLDEDQLQTEGGPDPIIASPVVAHGRVYVTSMDHVYAIGTLRPATGTPQPQARPAASTGAVAQVQVFPQEVMLDPGATQRFTVKLFDDKGVFVREAKPAEAQWSVELLQGAVGADGTYSAPKAGSAGFVKATVGGASGQARVRVMPSMPLGYDFEGIKGPMPWWTAGGKVQATTLEGNGVLLRARDDTVGRRARVILGRPTWTNYTIEADVRGLEMRRQRGDIGLINQRYALVLFGNGQKLELHPWQAADEMTVRVPFEWAPNTWYRMKLSVQPQAGGRTLVRGKVWPKDQPEPAAWTIEKMDTIGHAMGAPGLYADGISDLHFDNVRVY